MIENIKELLSYIDPAKLSYQEWVDVGMALHHEGHSPEEWDSWSQNDSRYQAGECYKKWSSFGNGSTLVTGGTIIHMAQEGGWKPEGYQGSDAFQPLDWDTPFINTKLFEEGALPVESADVRPMFKEYRPVDEIVKFLREMFRPEDIIGYCFDAFQDKEGKWKPGRKGSYTRSAGEIISELEKYKDIPSAMGSYNPLAGGWIRINPLDGQGVNNTNVIRYPYALVESDSQDLETQYAILQEMNLPIKALIHSGSRSLHAWVKVDASNREEYSQRVNHLFDICKENGLIVDTQNKNPSRLSRLPGLMRNGQRQYLIATDLGAESWEKWTDWLEDQFDDLPETESLDDFWDLDIQRKPELIEGILRVGHKLLLAAPSKAGKSFDIIELGIAIAEGGYWHERKCLKGRVLYVNFELDEDSCKVRVKDIYKALGIVPTPETRKNFEVWNLRGKAETFDKLVRKLIRRLKKKEYLAVIIDPIYKIITGDENSASEMAKFCNYFDKVCKEAKCAAIYCHHFSKGFQGAKASIDRASGSGVFARDPDAILSMIELPLPADANSKRANSEVCRMCRIWLEDHDFDTLELDSATLSSANNMLEEVRKKMPAAHFKAFKEEADQLTFAIKKRTAWRIECTLREFAAPDPINCYFRYPIHTPDEIGELASIKIGTPPSGKATEMRKAKAAEKRATTADDTKKAIQMVSQNGVASVKDVSEFLELSERAVYDRVKKLDGYKISNGNITII